MFQSHAEKCLGGQVLSARSAVAGRQLWTWLDVAARCNLSCKLCYTTAMRSHHVMAPRVFSIVVDRLLVSAAEVIKLHLNWKGEPLLNPGFVNMLSLLWERAPAWPVEWHTNGTRMDARLAGEVVRAHPRQTIFVSLDGGNAVSFEGNRGPGRWEPALRGLEALLRARDGGVGARVGVYQLDLGVPPSEYDPRFVDLTKHLDVYLIATPVGPDGSTLLHQHLDMRSPVPRGPCFWMGNTLAVDCNAAAFSCLLATATRLGSLLEEEVDALLDRASSLRAAVESNGRMAVAGCTNCRKQEGAATGCGQAREVLMSR